jgi:ABC-type Mn2+/Zn2+ transport system permease subunit
MTEQQAEMGNRYGPTPIFILAIGAMDWIWGRRVGLSIVGWTPTVIALVFCLLIKIVYSRVRPAPRLAELAAFGALWICFTSLGCILTYLAASVSRPFADCAFVTFDSKLGFNWVDWANFVHRHPALHDALAAPY